MGTAIKRASEAADLKARRLKLMERWKALKVNPANITNVAAMIGVTKPTLWRWEEGKGVKPPPEPKLQAWREAIAELEGRE